MNMEPFPIRPGLSRNGRQFKYSSIATVSEESPPVVSFGLTESSQVV